MSSTSNTNKSNDNLTKRQKLSLTTTRMLEDVASTPFEINNFGQPVGLKLPEPYLPPSEVALGSDITTGQYCILKRLQQDHCQALWEEFQPDPKIWTYLPFNCSGPITELEQLIRSSLQNRSRIVFSIFKKDNPTRPVGVAMYLNCDAMNGSVEVGGLIFSPKLSKTTSSTETLYLMINRAFELGWRRVEWKCWALNEPSRNAALRLGFTYEGKFRNHMVIQGRVSRDSLYFSIIREEYFPKLKQEFERWLSPNNFDPENGKQKTPLRCQEVLYQ
jgi:RimJ/RimL family protein N-acetyltransferase